MSKSYAAGDMLWSNSEENIVDIKNMCINQAREEVCPDDSESETDLNFG
jgi:hypothetical protein